VHLINQSGIPRETAGIQTAHLIDQGLQLLPRLGTILHYGTNLVEKVQSLVNLALGIGRVGTLLGRHGPTGYASIAGVISANSAAIAVGRATTGWIAYWTGEAVPDRTRLTSACLTTLAGLAVLPWLLTWLTGLTRLPVAVELAGLELLAAGLPGLTLSRLRVGTSAETGELVAQTG
jgi:hypothetical protein